MAQPTTTAALHPRPSSQQPTTATQSTTSSNNNNENALPPLLHTPTGLALLELQGTINLPITTNDAQADDEPINIGRIDFPDYKPDSITFDPSSPAWMKRVYLYVGQHQRLTGEVKKLPKALGIVRRRRQMPGSIGSSSEGHQGGGGEQQLEVVEVVKYKIVFSSRPEPVGTG